MKRYNSDQIRGIFLIIAGAAFILFTLLFTSCVTDKQLARNCDRLADVCNTSTHIEYRDTTLYIFDTLYVSLKPDTVTITDTVVIIDNFCQMPPVQERFGIISARASVYNSILNVHAWLNDSTIHYPIADTVYIEKATKQEKQIVTVKERYVPAFYKYLLAAFIGIVLFIAIWLIKKLSFSL
jgi:hypothetical protein